MKKLISIKIWRLGAGIRKIKIPENIRALELHKRLKLRKKHSLVRPKIELKNKSIIKENDVILIISPIEGAVDIKVAGKKWRINQNDKDNWPSNPHAHNIENGQKLDLFDGWIYCQKTKRKIRKLPKKHLKQIFDYPRVQQIRDSAQKIHP